VNVSDDAVRGRWALGFPLSEARLARLDETPLEPIPVEAAAVPFEVAPRGVVTILVR
jgi:hypothetical protein